MRGLRLPGLLILVFLSQLALPRVYEHPILAATIGGAGALLVLWLALLARRGRVLGVDVGFKRAHIGQACVHTSVYVYWGMYWADVPAQAPLILGQVAFLTVVEVLGSWSLNRRHRLGLGAFPIVFSTNLFLWFHDDWFALQYGMLVVSWLTKEFIKWDRGGQRVHVFNPSAISLALVGYVLIALGRTDIARAQEIAQTLGTGPHCYESIFFAGLIIMAIVPVAALTAGAAVTMLGLGWVWTQATGTYHFVDTAIPIAVFLGMNLLATDPVTTPRGPLGRLIAGMVYGTAVFFLYDALKLVDTRPGVTVTYFDKLLFVPVLNLMAPLLERVAHGLAGWRTWPRVIANPWIHMGMWSATFFLVVMPTTRNHPGRDPEYWQRQCEAGDATACGRALDMALHACAGGHPASCHNAAIQVNHRGDEARATTLFEQACAGGVGEACTTLGHRVLAHAGEGQAPPEALAFFQQGCAAGSGDGCARAAIALAATDAIGARDLAKKACDQQIVAGCSTLGTLLLQGQGGPRDPVAAQPLLDRACSDGQGTACANLAVMYKRGDGVPADPAQAEAYRQRACTAGVQVACEWKTP